MKLIVIDSFGCGNHEFLRGLAGEVMDGADVYGRSLTVGTEYGEARLNRVNDQGTFLVATSANQQSWYEEQEVHPNCMTTKSMKGLERFYAPDFY